jgi:hypothetical protein
MRGEGASGMQTTSFRFLKGVENVICPISGRYASGVTRSTRHSFAGAETTAKAQKTQMFAKNIFELL